MVRASYQQKPYRRVSTGDVGRLGRPFSGRRPRPPGVAGDRHQRRRARRRRPRGHPLLARFGAQPRAAPPDGDRTRGQGEQLHVRPESPGPTFAVIGCCGGGSNFGGLALPFVPDSGVDLLAVEPTACATLTEGRFDQGLRRRPARARPPSRPCTLFGTTSSRCRSTPAASATTATPRSSATWSRTSGARRSPTPRASVFGGGRPVRPDAGDHCRPGDRPRYTGRHRRGPARRKRKVFPLGDPFLVHRVAGLLDLQPTTTTSTTAPTPKRTSRPAPSRPAELDCLHQQQDQCSGTR